MTIQIRPPLPGYMSDTVLSAKDDVLKETDRIPASKELSL